MGEPLAEAASLARDPAAATASWRAEGGRVVGVVGTDVPLELLDAAGIRAVPIVGNPRGSTELADRWCEPQLDVLARSRLQRILDGSYGFVQRLLVCHDSEASLRVFYYLREIARLEPVLALPPLRFFDFVHLPHRTSTIWNRRRVEELRVWLGEWIGRTVDDDELHDAIVARNECRRLLAEIDTRRRGLRITGTELVRLVAAQQVLAPADRVALLEHVLAEEPVERQGARLFLSGSSHDTADVYELLESRGAVVVGEDHDGGARAFDGEVAEDAEPLDALVAHYQLGPSAVSKSSIEERTAYTVARARAAGADAAVIWLRRGDEGPAWDAPHQRAALTDAGIPTLVLDRQPYGAIDEPDLERLERLLASGVAA